MEGLQAEIWKPFLGLKEVMKEDYLHYRTRSIECLTEKLATADFVPVMRPGGGHAVYLDAKEMLPHISLNQYPAQALVAAL